MHPPVAGGVSAGAALRPLRHVCVFLADLGGGGAERMMVQLAAGFSTAGIRTDLVLAEARGPYLAEVPRHLNLVDLERGGVTRALPRLVRYLRRRRPQALVTTLHHTSLVALAARRLAGGDVRLVLREANTPSGQRIPATHLKAHLIAAAMRLAYREADGVLAVSRGVAEDLQCARGVPATKIATVYNPVVTDELLEQAGEEVDHPWLAPGEPPVVLAVGRLHPQKDFSTLLRAFARLRRRRSVRLIILGDGAELGPLLRLADELGVGEEVDLPGFVANPFAFMARASLLALSSVREGLPSVLVQALACGCPVVATDCPSGPAEILAGGRYGQLVPVRDAEALADAMAGTLDRPPEAASLRQAVAPFHVERVVQAHVRALEAIGLPDVAQVW